MNKMLNRGSFYSQAATPYGARFEKPEAELFGMPPVCVQFGSRLRRVFELPGAGSEADQFQALIRQIEMKLDSKI